MVSARARGGFREGTRGRWDVNTFISFMYSPVYTVSAGAYKNLSESRYLCIPECPDRPAFTTRNRRPGSSFNQMPGPARECTACVNSVGGAIFQNEHKKGIGRIVKKHRVLIYQRERRDKSLWTVVVRECGRRGPQLQ